MLKKNEKKEVSNNELARMVAKGFARVDEQFEDVHRAVATKADIARLEARIEAIADLIDSVEEGQVLPLQRRVSILEKGYRALSKHILGK